MKALNFLTSMCEKKEVCCRQLSRKSSIFLQRKAGSQVTMLEIEDDVSFSWRGQILAIMRSIGKGRLYTCPKHPNHQISSFNDACLFY